MFAWTSKKNLATTALFNDPDAWDRYANSPCRWTFNKLEVALRQGLHCGPAASAPRSDGWYIHRPVYNLYGMGIGAEKFYYESTQRSSFLQHAVVPPGHFWCQWLDGPHASIDYQRNANWSATSYWIGEHASDENLTKFQSWERKDEREAPPITDFDLLSPLLDYVNEINIETRSGVVIEIHLRLGEMPDVPVGTVVEPIWDEQESDFPDTDPQMAATGAFGHLTAIRKGFRLKSSR
jgi:hypothetical protein